MSVTKLEFSVNDLAGFTAPWTDLMVADLVEEVEKTEALSATDMRLALSIKGYREIHEVLEAETKGKCAVAALRAMTLAFRRYAKEKPGLSAATFRSPIVESAEWMQAADAVQQLFFRALKQCGLDEIAAGHALRMIRSLVHGYVISEMSGSFYLPADQDESFDLAVDVFLRGLPALMPCSHEYRSRSTDVLMTPDATRV